MYITQSVRNYEDKRREEVDMSRSHCRIGSHLGLKVCTVLDFLPQPANVLRDWSSNLHLHATFAGLTRVRTTYESEMFNAWLPADMKHRSNLLPARAPVGQRNRVHTSGAQLRAVIAVYRPRSTCQS
jgi:hypothetical protein